MGNPPKAPQILKVRNNPPPKTPLMVGDWRYLYDGHLIAEYQNKPTYYGSPKTIDNLVPNEVRYLKGDWIIEGNIPDGVRIELAGGNLEVQGNLGNNVILKNTKGSIQFDYAGEGCTVIANHGPVTFIHAGYSSSITGTSVSADTLADGVCVQSTRGNITLQNGKDGTQLISAQDITFHSVGAFSTLKAGGTLSYHTIGLKSEISTANEICTQKMARSRPSTRIDEATHTGMVVPTPLCSGVSYDKQHHRFLLEMRLGVQDGSGQAMAALVMELNKCKADMKAFIPEDGHTNFIIAPPEDKPEQARVIKKLIHNFVKEQNRREAATSPSL